MAASRADGDRRDRNDALGLAIYGHLQSYLLKDYGVAQDYLERAHGGRAECAWAWAYSSLTCGYLGDIANAIARAERLCAIADRADSFWLEHYLSQAYYLGVATTMPIAWGRMSAAHGGANTSNLRCLIASLVATGEMDEARKVARQLMRLVPTFRLSTSACERRCRRGPRPVRRPALPGRRARLNGTPACVPTNVSHRRQHARELRRKRRQ